MTAGAVYSWLAPAIDDGAVVLASSRRLSRELQQHYHSTQLASAAVAWPTPAIYFWQDWLAEQLENSIDPDRPTLLDATAATLLWEQSLDATSRQDLLSIAGVLRHAQAAWTRLQEWQVTTAKLEASAVSRDEHWFVRAAGAYASRLSDGNWVDRALLAAECRHRIDDDAFDVPKRMVYAGFDRLTPALRALFSALSERGSLVDAAPAPSRGVRRHLRSYADDATHWRAAGHWARQIVEQTPTARIAIVAPDLESRAGVIGRLVREGFAPGWQLGDARYRRSVNVSFGQRLANYPSVTAALQALSMAARGIPSTEVSMLLRSRSFGFADHANAARAELGLREYPERQWQVSDVLSALPGPPGADEPEQQWRRSFMALLPLQEQGGERALPSLWAERFDASLAAAGWPGPGSSDSDEFQLLNRWRQLFNQLAALDRVAGALPLVDALRQLQRLATDTIFQPEAMEGGITVMGLLETAGLEFDHLWVGGLDADHWPPAGNPLALVNRQLQKSNEMPDAVPADTLKFARRNIERLEASATECCFSWYRGDGDNVLTASPLLRTDEHDVLSDVDDPGWFGNRLLGTGRLHELDGDDAPKVHAGEKISGGAGTVQRMREEPFSAFAVGRLAAESPEAFRAGLSAKARGNLVHTALEKLLNGCSGHAALCQWSDTDIATRAEEAAYRARAGLLRVEDPVLRKVLDMEKTRLEAILGTFIRAERERPPFTIESLEERFTLVRGHVQLSLRIDRIDRLESGGLLLADYKTGAGKKLLGKERELKSVQLSVYASAVNETIDALAFINIDSREIAYQGAGAGFRSGKLKIADDEWGDYLALWRKEVDTLLARFADGELGVNIVQPADDARPLALLNRVAELRRDG